MWKLPLKAFAATMVLGLGAIGQRAEALPAAMPSMIFARVNSALLQETAIVCGNTGCAPIQTKRVEKRRAPPPPPTRPSS